MDCLCVNEVGVADICALVWLISRLESPEASFAVAKIYGTSVTQIGDALMDLSSLLERRYNWFQTNCEKNSSF